VTKVFITKKEGFMATLIKCPKCGSNRLEPVKQADGLAGKMGMVVYLCLNCGKESKIKDKK
jgi:DNA-directed RNA polymerase subunit RPC12/RpoP